MLGTPLGWALLFATASAQAQSGGTSVVPSISLSQTFTDNRELTATNRRADAITRISPGISLSSRSGAVRGFFNYAGTAVIHARDAQLNDFVNSLDARGTAELIERRFTIDANARIAQQAISAFGTRSVDPALTERNRSEVFTYSIAPLLRGRLLGEIDYQARLAYSSSRSSATSVGDSSALTSSVGVSGGRGLFGWGLDAQRSIAESGIDGRRTLVGGVTGSISYRPDVDYQFALRAGRESNNVVNTTSTFTWGGSASWSPGPRTRASVSFDRRFFGNSHSISFSHRFARTIWTFTDSRDLSTGGVNGASAISLYDLYFQLFASLEPNPALRDVRVREFLRLNGLDPTAVVSSGFLSSSNSVQRRSNLSFAMQGIRHTANASVFMGDSSRLGAVVAGAGDLAQADSVRQLGYTLGWTYRLTPVASLNVSGSVQRTHGSGTQPGNQLRSVVAGWSTALGERTSVSLSLRHTVSDGNINTYQESALIGSMSMRF